MSTAKDAAAWSEWIREDVQRVHTCAQNTDPDIGVLFHQGLEGMSRWVLCTTWVATNEDVEAGKAPEAGDILSATELRIAYCPFCGEHLPASG